MTSWKEDVWALVREHRTQGEKFTLSWLYGYGRYLARSHPENRAINAKLRQVCQELAADGKVIRLSPGLYQVMPLQGKDLLIAEVNAIAREAGL